MPKLKGFDTKDFTVLTTFAGKVGLINNFINWNDIFNIKLMVFKIWLTITKLVYPFHFKKTSIHLANWLPSNLLIFQRFPDRILNLPYFSKS